MDQTVTLCKCAHVCTCVHTVVLYVLYKEPPHAIAKASSLWHHSGPTSVTSEEATLFSKVLALISQVMETVDLGTQVSWSV